MTLERSLLDKLAEQLALPLPGASARASMAPELSYGRHDGPPPWNVRLAAVILLVFPREQLWYLPLTRRPDTLAAHGGQVSLPGGEIDAAETVEEAAVRELDEELGVIPDDLRMLGRLTPIYIYASNFLVTPCVAGSDTLPRFRPNPDEVANLINLPLVDLLDPAPAGNHEIQHGDITFRAPHFDVDGERVWGATSMILAEFAAVLKEVQERSRGVEE
jgi:8-oxo-dGTP pyrophosphatase MutT (NUDIX family)